MAIIETCIEVNVEVRMSIRARLYLLTTAASMGAVGVYAIVGVDALRTPSYATIHSIAPFPVWGVSFLLVAVASLTAAVSGIEWVARVGLMGAAVLEGMWASGLWYAFAHGHQPVWARVAVWAGLCLKDIVACSQPLRAPLEPFVRKFSGRAHAG